MRKQLACLTFVAALPCLALLGACATTASGLGEQAGTTELPTGLKLLDSEKGECTGNVQMDQSSVLHADLGSDLFVNAGQHGTFQVSEGDVRWACVHGSSPNVEELNCPSDTHYVRVTRDEDGDSLLFECFG